MAVNLGLFGRLHVQKQGNAATLITRAKAPRFYVEGGLGEKLAGTLSLDKNETNHAANVLRMQPGDIVELCDGLGHVAKGIITQCNKKTMQVECTGPAVFEEWKGPKILLAVGCCSLKGGRADMLVEKATELGAWGLIPVLSSRSSVLGGRNGEGRSGRLSRWDRIAFAAMKQCLRSHALEVHDPCTVETLTDMIQRNQNSFLGATGAPPFGQTLLALEPSMRERIACSLLIVGPEGDFTEEEQTQMVRAGATCVGLGSNRLRVETAAIAMLSAFQILCANE